MSHELCWWGIVLTRLGARLEHLQRIDHPVDCAGDLRAVNPALHLIMACRALHRGLAPGGECLIFAGDDNGERAGCLVRSVNGKGT